MVIGDRSTTKIYIPISLTKGDGEYSLLLRNTVTKKEYELEDIEDENPESSFWYSVEVDFSEYPLGEYEYILSEDGVEQAKGLLRIGTKPTDAKVKIVDIPVEFKSYDVPASRNEQIKTFE